MLDPLLIQRAIQRIAEQRIAAAQRAGQFDHLPGAGKPIPGIDEPPEEFWWLKKYLQRENLSQAQLLRQLNQIIRQKKAAASSSEPPD